MAKKPHSESSFNGCLEKIKEFFDSQNHINEL